MRRSVMLVLAAVLPATPALALTVTKTVDVAAAPAKVWQTIGGFCGIGDWHPVIEKCELGAGPTRTLSLKGGGTIVEKQLSRNDAAMRYSYAILSGPLPVAHYRSTIKVQGAGGGSKVTWTGNFDAKGASDAKAREAIAGVYDAGLKGIAEKAH